MIQDAFIRLRAKQLYWQGYPPAEISRLMGISQNTIYSWKKRDGWDETPPVERVTQSIDARLVQLTSKAEKSGGDFKEIDLLTRQLAKLNDNRGGAEKSGTADPLARRAGPAGARPPRLLAADPAKGAVFPAAGRQAGG